MFKKALIIASIRAADMIGPVAIRGSSKAWRANARAGPGLGMNQSE